MESNIAKFFPQEIQKKLIEKINAKPGDLLLLAADKEKVVNDVLNKIRLKLGNDLGLIDKSDFAFCFITDFPLFEYSEEEGKWDFAHNPFTMPKEDYIQYLESDPKSYVLSI